MLDYYIPFFLGYCSERRGKVCVQVAVEGRYGDGKVLTCDDHSKVDSRVAH